jgi:hypothetical protein
MNDTVIQEIRRNIFHAAHPAIKDWSAFSWHTHKHEITTGRRQSSQALAIDIMGTLEVSPARSAILNALAGRMGLPLSDTWEVQLEWPAGDLLAEPRPTQVDAAAFGDRTTILFESKFTESGGHCSQTARIAKGAHKGARQCDGAYHMQTNPVNGVEARCALSGKDIEYWAHIPKVFGFPAGQDRDPCPFAGSWYQYMRNLVLAAALKKQGKQAGVVLLYAEHPAFSTNKWLRSDDAAMFRNSLGAGAPVFHPLSSQDMVRLAMECDPSSATWRELQAWVDGKIATVAKELTHATR